MSRGGCVVAGVALLLEATVVEVPYVAAVAACVVLRRALRILVLVSRGATAKADNLTGGADRWSWRRLLEVDLSDEGAASRVAANRSDTLLRRFLGLEYSGEVVEVHRHPSQE